MSLESPTNRDELIAHCKKRITILRVNISPDQEKIVVAKAIKKFLEYHHDATEKRFVAQEVTQDVIDDGYFTTPEDIYEVNTVLSYRAAISASNLVFNEIGSGSHYSFYLGGQGAPASGYGEYTSPLIYYFMAKQNKELYSSHFNREDLFRWSRTSRRLHLIGGPQYQIGSFLVYQADVSLESEDRFWQNEWLIEYTTALLKQTWGENLTKFNNVELPGNIQLNGQEIKSEARDRVRDLEEELISQHANYTMIYIS